MSSPPEKGYAYQAVYAYLATLIGEATGERRIRLPSLRDLSRRLGVSVSTVQHAYQLLESEGKIFSVAKSGYYAAVDRATHLLEADTRLDLLHSVYTHACTPGMLALHRSEPWPSDAMGLLLTRQEREIQRQHANLGSHPFGEPELRRELAARYTRSTDHQWCSEDVYLAADLRAVLEITLQALGVRGETVLITSPASPVLLMALKYAGARICELPLDGRGGLDLQRAASLLRARPIKLAVLGAVLNGAQGTQLAEDVQESLAALLNQHGTLVLEDDDHTPLCFAPSTPLRALIDPDRLLVFGSFSRMIGAEARFGYVLCRGPSSLPVACSIRQHLLQRDSHLPPVRQKAIARLCSRGAIDRHLGPLRSTLRTHVGGLVQQLDEGLGDLITVPMPAGGSSVWVQSRHRVDGREVYAKLLTRHILVGPGEVFSAQGRHHQCLRIGCPTDGRGLPSRVMAHLRDALRHGRR